MRIADVEITAVSDGHIRFPATAAYPGTTEADWEPHARWLTHDGMLELPIGCFLIRVGDRTMLVDAGLGPYVREGLSGGRLMDELEAAGVRRRDVTDVVFTHLHFDHVGWATSGGEIVFENATYRCHAADWTYFVEDAGSAGAPRKLGPLADRLETWDGQATLAPGVDTLPTPGHTPGHTAFVVSGDGERALLLGDVVHCPAELTETEWDGMGDVDPVLARTTREALFRELEEQGTPATGSHLPGLRFGRVLRTQTGRSWLV